MDDLEAGVPKRLSRRVWRIVAPNPGVMTGPGTNTYLVGNDEITVIDPGPADPAHLEAIQALGGERIRSILVTHTHVDHAPGAGVLRDRLHPGVALLGFGPRDGFYPDAELRDGDVIGSDECRLRVIHTPGHASNHLCYLLEDERLLFSGDHIMNGSTVVIAPPDGDMAAYLVALRRLRGLGLETIAPGHGDLIVDPAAKIDEYVAHRLAREAAVAEALMAAGSATVEQLVPSVYRDVNPTLHPIARLSLWAHLRKLAADGRAAAADPDDPHSTWKDSRQSTASRSD